MKTIGNYKQAGPHAVGKLPILGLALAMLGASVPGAQAQGKLEVAKVVIEEGVKYGKELGTLLTGISRGASIVIRNNTSHRLKNLRVYMDSGKVLELDGEKEISANDAGGLAIAKSDSALAGAVGVISYEIEGTGDRLFVMVSIPYEQSGIAKRAKNWFNFNTWRVDSGWKTDADMFEQMYNNMTPFQAGRGVENVVATAIFDQAGYDAAVKGVTFPIEILTIRQKFSRPRWQMKGTMVDAGESKVVIDLFDVW